MDVINLRGRMRRGILSALPFLYAMFMKSVPVKAVPSRFQDLWRLMNSRAAFR